MKKLRKDADLSQQHLAENLGMARATYASLEANRREPDLAEMRALAEFYEMSLHDLLNHDNDFSDQVNEPTIQYKTAKNEQKPRDVTPEVNPNKLREVLLYVLEQDGAKPNVGETVLYKLLYFIDFDYYEKNQESITGLTYVRNHYGPTPTMTFVDVVKQMEKNKELEVVSTKFFNNTQRKYLPTKPLELRHLSANELLHIDQELSRLGDKTARELTDLSHLDAPWRVAKQGKPINYRFVFYRTDLTAVTEPEDEL
jgi:transcriptional regulator with XRE-family HTH domain